MTSLMHWVRRTDTRRGVGAIAGVTFVLALAGCNEDRASNANAKTPIAVTAAGVEIREVVKREDTRTVEAVVVTGGEERQVTLAPLLDGPLPSGMRATLTSSDNPTSLAFSWDARSGAVWVRHEVNEHALEVERVVINGRVVEDYAFGGQILRLEYSDLPPAVMDKAIAIHQRGEPLVGVSADVIEFATQLQAFDAFVAQLPPSFVSGSDDAGVLIAVIGDEAFGEAVFGSEFNTNNVATTFCRNTVLCAAVFCRMSPVSTICGLCTAGALACMVMDLFCSWAGCDCCFD